MASSILLDLLNETETPLNLPVKSKNVPSKKVSSIDRHHEGWNNKQKYVDSHTSIVEDLMNQSFSSQDSWDTSENNHNIFKNALANLSEGLAIMHKKGKSTKKEPIQEKTQPKTCTSIKPERRIQSRQVKRHRPTASLGSLDKGGATENDSLGQTETGKPFRRHKDTLDSSRESLPQTHNTMPPELKALYEAKGIQGFIQVSKEYAPKAAKPLKLDRANDLVGFKASREVNICEFVLKSAKPENLGPRIFPMNSYNHQVPLTLEKSGQANNMHNALMKQSKPTRTVRTVSLSSIDEHKDPGHWVSLEQGFSPRNAPNKTENSLTGQQARNSPFLKQQRRILVRRGPSPIERIGTAGENSRAVTPTGGAVRTTVVVKSRERVSSAAAGYQTAPNPIINRRNSHGDAAEANKDGTLRSILGQVFVNEVRKPPRSGANTSVVVLEKNNNRYTGAAGFMNKSCFTSDENAKDPVEYILSLYKSGAEKSLEKAKIGTRNERMEGGFKVMDCLKRTAEYNRQKNIQRVGDFSLGDSNILKERISKQRDASAGKSNKNELGVEISINPKRRQGYSDKLKLIL